MAFRHAETTLSHAKWRASGVASFRLSPTTIARHEESDRDQGTGGMRSTRHVFLLMNGAVDRSNPVNDGIFTISRISAINRMLMNRKPPRHTSLLHSTLGFDGSLTGHELGVFYLGMSQIHRRCKVTNCWLIRCLHNAPKRNIIYIWYYIYSITVSIYIYIAYLSNDSAMVDSAVRGSQRVTILFQLFRKFGFLEVSSTKQFRACATMLYTRVTRIKQTYAHECASSCNHARQSMTKPYFVERSCYGIEYLLDLRTYIIKDNLTTENQDRIKTSNTSSWTIAWIS